MTLRTVTPRTVRNGDVSLATVDHGGDGPPLLLTHGFAGTKTATRRMLPFLTGTHRVITFDLRGHGESSAGPWTLDNAASDVDAIVAAYDLPTPAVAGHSLGGMVAIHWGQSHPDTPGVINIDGWGPGLPERFPGEDPQEVTTFLRSSLSGEANPWLIRLYMKRLRQTKEGTTAAVMQLLDGLDFVETHANATCRSLAINATAPNTGLMARVSGKRINKLQGAYRAGLSRDLALAAERNPQLTVVEIDATHGLIATHAEQTARAINEFLAA